MKKKLIFSGMLVCLLALGLALVGCKTDGDDDSGGDGGASVAEEYRGVYTATTGGVTWTLEVKEKTLEVQKGTTGAVKIIPVTSAQKKTNITL